MKTTDVKSDTVMECECIVEVNKKEAKLKCVIMPEYQNAKT